MAQQNRVRPPQEANRRARTGLAQGERLVFSKYWYAELLGFEQQIALDIWWGDARPRFCLRFHLGTEIVQWSFSPAGDDVHEFEILSRLTVRCSISSFQQNDVQLAFDLRIDLQSFVTVMPAHERVLIALPPEQSPLAQIDVQTVTELERLLAAMEDSSDVHEEDEGADLAAGKRKCWTKRNCTGVSRNKFNHCHNCKNKAGKSLGTPTKCETC